ncbi:hypothetical protein LINPERPRIM_LOCUS35360, partial [Linum perenne]
TSRFFRCRRSPSAAVDLHQPPSISRLHSQPILCGGCKGCHPWNPTSTLLEGWEPCHAYSFLGLLYTLGGGRMR